MRNHSNQGHDQLESKITQVPPPTGGGQRKEVNDENDR